MPPSRRAVALVVPVAGFLLGFLDFVWIKWVPFPFAELGNSTATWAVAAFALGWWIRSGAVRAALAASVLLIVAVPSYYLAATLLQGDDLAVIWALTSFVWMAFGVVAGVVFGVAGIWARTDGWRRVVGTALPVAVFVEEALRFALKSGSYPGAWWNVAIDLGLAVLLVVLIGRSARVRLLAAAVALPLAAAGALTFAAVAGS
ncbi:MULTISPECIES: DUF6518 family protein [Micromonospora]|uniref:DUF4175 domain-containing protein n=1 Tax=Micromonospora chalcea TaxID=1874 RepID=A0ABX9Y2Q8_MICCH|nr:MULTISPECIES: DUF6518 family protein [Micromonospora]ODB74008.1 hypothetical protein A8711_10930 [Micromonospora sp. II]RQW92034.1 hypothetical protein DLJ60_15760 [Micromonospora chalcea]